MAQIGILGGTRFIGYHLARTLLKVGHQVTLFNRGQTRPPEPFPSSLNRIYGDRNRPSDINNFMVRTYDAVFDLSGYCRRHVRPLLLEIHRSKIRHYIFCSTSSVYEVPPPCPYNETAPRTTLANTYGGEKALVENLLMDAWKKDRWPITILRAQGVFGPFDAPQAAFVFSRLKSSFPIFLGPARRYRINFLYINDLITTFMQLLNQHLSYGKIYNIAGDDVTTQVEFVNLCAEVSSLEPQIRIIDNTKYKHLQIGFPWLEYDLVADNRAIKNDLNLHFTLLKKGLAKTWGWLQSSPDHLLSQPFRGEKYIRENRPIPVWVKVCWKLDDATRFSPLRKLFISPLLRLLKRLKILA